MNAVVFARPGELSTELVEVPNYDSAAVLISVAYLGLCGTDYDLLSGDSLYVRRGLTEYPIRFGHEWSGVVIACGDSVGLPWLGRRVTGGPFLSCGQCSTCRGGHYNLCPGRAEIGVRGSVPGAAAEYMSIPVGNISQVPDRVSLKHAVMAEPAVTVLNAFERGAVQPGERLVVIGTGAMGMLAVQLGVGLGCHVDVIGIDSVGMELACGAGAVNAYSPEEAPSDWYDVVIEAAGATTAAKDLGRVARPAARILQIGIPSQGVDGYPIADLVTKGLVLIGVLGGVHLMPRALELIRRRIIRPDELIDRVLPICSIQEAFVAMNEHRARPKIILDMNPWARVSVGVG